MATATNSAIQKARDAGLSDQDIADYLAEKLEPGVVRAREEGIPDEDIVDYLLTRKSLGPARSDAGARGGRHALPASEATAETIAGPAPAPPPFTPYGDYYSTNRPSPPPPPGYENTFGYAINQRADELLADPIKKGYRQTAQASNVFTGGTPVESIESSAHDIAARERQIKGMPTADYMQSAQKRADDAIQSLLTPEQQARLYERRQYFDDLANGVEPRMYLPEPQIPARAFEEDRKPEVPLVSAIAPVGYIGTGMQPKPVEAPKEYNLPGDPPGAPPIIGLTSDQEAAATAKIIWAYLQDPRATINVSLESLTASGTGLAMGFGGGAAGGSAAGPPGAVGGAMLGAGTGSFLTEYGNDVLDQMRQEGYDLTNEHMVLQALQNPEFMARVKDHALKRGVAVGAFDALSAGIGGRVASPFERAVTQTRRTFGGALVGDAEQAVGKTRQAIGKAVGEGAEILAQGAAGGAGEIAGAVNAGDQVDPTAVAQEVIGEAGSGGAEILSGRYNKENAERRQAEEIEAFRNSPQGRAEIARAKALSSGLSLLNMIRNPPPAPDTMPEPALTGSRDSEPAGGKGTAPIPPAAQGTARALQQELKEGTTYKAPDGEYAVVAVSPNPDPDKHFLGLRGPNGELRPWTASEFAAHIERANAATAQQTQREEKEEAAAHSTKVKKYADLSSALRRPTPVPEEVRHEKALLLAMAQMHPPADTAAAKKEASLFEALVAKVERPAAEKYAALSSKLREPKAPEPQKSEAEQIALAMDQMRPFVDSPAAREKAQSFGDLISNFGKPESERKPPPPPSNPAPPAAPASTEPASKPAPQAAQAVSTAQEPAGGVAPAKRDAILATLDKITLQQAGDLDQLTRSSAIPEGEWEKLRAAGLVHTKTNADGEPYEAVDTLDLGAERDRRAAEEKRNRKPVTQEERDAGIERRAQHFDSVAKEHEEEGDHEKAKELRAKAAEIRDRKGKLDIPPPPAPRMKGTKRTKKHTKELEDERANVEALWPQYQRIKKELEKKHEYLADKTQERIEDAMRGLRHPGDFNHYKTSLHDLGYALEEAIKRVEPKPKPLQKEETYPTGKDLGPVRENVGAQEKTDPGDVTELPTTQDKFEEVVNEFPALFAAPEKRVSLPLERHWKKKGTPFLSPQEAARRIESWQAHAEKQGKIAYPKGNDERVILSLFDLTGHWAAPYIDAGYTVHTFDIQSGQDVRDFSVEWFSEHHPDISDVYGILIAVPCTDFTSSGNQHWPAKDVNGSTELSKELVFKALQTVEYFRPAMWVLENPVGRIEELTGLPPARMVFDPWHFGDPYTKRTVLWGKFNANLPTAPVDPVQGSKMWSQFGGKSQATKNARSATPQGFASAFFMANNYLDATPAERLLSQFPLAAGAIEKALAAGFSEAQIREVVTYPYEDYHDEEARDALKQLVKTGTPEPAPEVKAEPEPEKKAELTPEVKTEPAAKTPATAAKPKQPETKGGMFTGAHPILTDRREEVITPDGTQVETAFEVVDAADLITSDDSRFPKQYQPRKRERKTSEDQIRDIIANFDPLQLGPSRLASHGAPIIGMDDNYVESGNGRVMALRRVYGNHPELAVKYRKYVGLISGVDVSKMKAPVLVRRRLTEMTDEQRVKWARQANKDAIMQMSAAEKAGIDQEKLTASVMAELPDNMDEPLKLVEGKGLEFVERFVAQFTPAERGELIDADGKVSSIALNRAKAALLQKAYGGTPAGDAAIRRAAESTDTDAATLVNTLMRFGPAFAQLKDEIAAGRVQEQADIGSHIAQAVEVVRAAGSPGAVTRWLNTEDLLDPKDATVKQLIQTFYSFDGRGDAKRLRSAAAIGATLAGYLKEARQYTPAGAGGGLFGEEETAVLNPAAQLAKLNAGRKEQEQESEQQDAAQAKGQGGLFTAGGKPSSAASTGTSDEGGRKAAQSTGPSEGGDTGDVEASAEDAGEEVSELGDLFPEDPEAGDGAEEFGIESAMDGTEEAADTEEAAGTEESKRFERQDETIPLPSTSRENLMRFLKLDPAAFRALGGREQWNTAVKALKDMFGFADIKQAKGALLGPAVDHLLDAFVSLQHMASALGAGTRIASLNGRITLHMRAKPGKTKGYFRYKAAEGDPDNTIAIYERQDVYSHELAHGIDYDMMERAGGMKPGALTRMIRERANTGTLPKNLLQAWADVMSAIYDDAAAIAALIKKAEHQLLNAKTPSDKARIQKRLDNLRTGLWRGAGARTQFFQRAAKGPMKKYLTKPTELFARVFEAYIAEKIQKQQQLGLHRFIGATDAIYRDDADAEIKRMYPHGLERQRIFSALDNLVGAIMRDDIYNVGTQSPGIVNSQVNLGLIDPVSEAKANGTPITPDIVRAHNLTNKAAQTFLEDEAKRNDTLAKNFEQLVDDLKAGRATAGQHLRAAAAKFASTPDSVFAFLETRFPQIRILRKIRNELSDAHIAGRDKPLGFYREWQRTEHSITNDLADRMAAVGITRNMPKADAEHFWDVAHGLAKPKNKAVERQVDQFLYELRRMWNLRDKTGEQIGFVDEAYVNRVFLKDVADNPAFHADLLRLRVKEKNDLIVKLQSQRLAATDPQEIARLKAKIKEVMAYDPMIQTRDQIAKMKGLVWGEPVYLGAMNEDSAKERVFGPAADEILKDYYVKDPATLLQMYGSAAARGIALRRRYGLNPNEVFQGWLNQTALELPKVYADLLKNAMEVSMGFRRDGHGSLTRMVNGAANVTTAAMLGRAVFPNVAEPLNVLGRGVSLPVTFGALMKATVPFMTSSSTRKRFAAADRFGRLSGTLVDAVSSATAMAQHIGEDTLGNGILARFSVRAYWYNYMSSLTAWQQKVMNRVGFELFYHIAQEIRKGGPGVELYRQWFREHGIADPDAMAKFLEKSGNIDSIDLYDTLSGTGLTLANATAQLVHTNIQHPTPSTKHIQANRGVIGVIFRLTSWITTNFANFARYIKNKIASAFSGKYGGEELDIFQRVKGERAGQKLTAHERIFGRVGGIKLTAGQRVNAMAVTSASALVGVYVAQACFVIARMMLTNPDEWEDRGDDFFDRFTNRKTQLQIAQYWGIMGWMMNTAVDAVEGTRYNRGIAGSLAGPAYGGWEQDGERLMQGAVSLADQATGKKDVTQAVKNNAAQASYHLLAQLVSVGLLNTLPARKTWARLAGFTWSVVGTSPWAGHKFADTLTGEKTKELQSDAKAGDADAIEELDARKMDDSLDPTLKDDLLDPNQ